ncbi:hypothetical protein ACFXPA_29200, partial [Amycolatopsis sp. NPDC059090]|uniref:hypothetical protein n=1 Tax=Amycolatopsis sp. NPDC059090 TaxID=3346723 RepID=UPI003672A310
MLAETHPQDLVRLVDAVRPAAEGLPLRLRQFLVSARQRESEIFVVSGLPVSTDLTSTPENWGAAERTGAGLREELVLLLCGSLVGDPVIWLTPLKRPGVTEFWARPTGSAYQKYARP